MEERKRLLLEIARAQAFLHDKSIIHRDLKLENVLMANDRSIRLMDFGLSKLVDFTQQMTVGIGTSIYMAPELTLGQPYDQSVDVFAFGILAFMVLTLNLSPYAEDPDDSLSTPTSVQIKVAQDASYRPKKGMDTLANDSLVDLIEKCWDNAPEKRPTFPEIIRILKKGGPKESQEKEEVVQVEFVMKYDTSVAEFGVVKGLDMVSIQLQEMMVGRNADKVQILEVLDRIVDVRKTCVLLMQDKH